MSSKFDFAVMDPGDGFRLIERELHAYGQLSVGFWQAGVPEIEQISESGHVAQREVNIGVFDLGDVDANASFQRHRHLTEALLRYFNLGGDWESLGAVLLALKEIVPGGMLFEGWVYDSSWTENGDWHHAFAEREGNQIVIWQEGWHIYGPMAREEAEVDG